MIVERQKKIKSIVQYRNGIETGSAFVIAACSEFRPYVYNHTQYTGKMVIIGNPKLPIYRTREKRGMTVMLGIRASGKAAIERTHPSYNRYFSNSVLVFAVTSPC